MNTQQLECFVRIADKLNFTKVAEELYITAPAVAHHIINLEELNTSLFILSLIHISEPTRQAEISYAVFCLKKKKKK